MKEFVTYYERTWILSWPIEAWSVALMYISTDNTSEIYHSALNRRVSENHTTTDKLLFHLMTIEENAIKHIHQMGLGNHENQTLHNPWKKRMMHLMNDIVNGSILIDEFFAGMESVSIERNCVEIYEDDELYDDGSSIEGNKLKGRVRVSRKGVKKVKSLVDNRRNFKSIKKLHKQRQEKLKEKKRLEIQKEPKRKMKAQEKFVVVRRKIKTRSCKVCKR